MNTRSEPQIVSFDFDDTLILGFEPNIDLIASLRAYAAAGAAIVIVTSRNPDHDTRAWADEYQPRRILIQEFIEYHCLPVSGVYFTNHALKGPLLARLGVTIHHDDNPMELQSCWEHGVEAVRI